MRAHSPKFFDVRELVTPEIFAARGEAALELLDARALYVLDALRDVFGPLTVNNWHRGGAYKESGLRAFSTTTGAEFSQHKFGRAFDCKFRDATPDEAFDYLLANAVDWPEITVLEDVAHTPTWLHFDVRNGDWKGIRVVKP